MTKKPKSNSPVTEDVEMKSVDNESAESGGAKAVPDVDSLTIEELREQARQIEKSVSSKEPRFVLRVLRSLATTRKKLNSKVMRKVINGFYTQTNSNNQKESLLAFIDEPMETDSSAQTVKPKTSKTANLPLLPELDIYFHLLVLLYLIDLERKENVCPFNLLLIQFSLIFIFFQRLSNVRIN